MDMKPQKPGFCVSFYFLWSGKRVGGDRPFSSVMRSARWRALRGGFVRGVEGKNGGGSGGT